MSIANAGRTFLRKRLVVCLDGTWNKQDDSTNVLHAFHAVVEGPLGSGWEQRRYYDQGVGTGVLDGVSGGAFGLGLEANVREAMNWLAANYDDGDEIYVFGFSRGAFTARSLMALLAVCGIPRRGAPLTVNQLWAGYCLHGRRDDGRRNWWEKLAGELEPPFRNVSNLVPDSWRQYLEPGDWRRNYKPWKEPEKLKPVEEVLRHWTRRPPITFLGIFDTVGSLGIDALAIPGLRSRLATYHNMRLHSTVGKARHALAIDEHRSNFAPTALMEWVPQHRDALDLGSAIVQRWFVGAHSNIGGGYPTNVLASEPLDWVLAGAASCGLELRARTAAPALNTATAQRGQRDSYVEFGAIWAHVLRCKRAYRVIAPPAYALGDYGAYHDSGGRRRHALRPVESTVSDTVWQLVDDPALETPYAPPNLVEWARRNRHPRAEYLQQRCRHVWSGRGWLGGGWLCVWALFAALGFAHAPRLFGWQWPGPLPWWLLALLGGLAVGVDWGESRLNHTNALDPERPVHRALRDVLFWCRATTVVFVAVGAVVFAWSVWCVLPIGPGTWRLDAATWWRWFAPFAAAAATVVAIHRIEPAHPTPKRPSRFSPWILAVVLFGTFTGALAVRSAYGHWFGQWDFELVGPLALPNPAVANAGALLLLELTLLLFLQSLLSWVADPMRDARLRSIFALQVCFSPRAVFNQCRRWFYTLLRRRMPGDPPDGASVRQRAMARLQFSTRQTLWRENLGFVSLYTLLFLLAMWFAATTGMCAVVHDYAYLVWLLPVGVALLDVIENCLHLHFLSAFARGRPPRWPLVLLAIVATSGKMAGVAVCLLGVHVAIFLGGWRLLVEHPGWEDAGWRGALAVLLAAAIAVALFGQILLWLREGLRKLGFAPA